MGHTSIGLSRWLMTGVALSVALMSLSAFAQGPPDTGLAAGGTVLRRGQEKPFVTIETGHNWSFAFTRDFKELLDVAQTSDIDGLPKIAADKIKRIDFKPYSAAELASIKKADTTSVINCPGWCRFRKATVLRLDGKSEDVFLYCTVNLYGPENESYYLGNLDIQAVIAR
jgi:hypothetical protein